MEPNTEIIVQGEALRSYKSCSPSRRDKTVSQKVLLSSVATVKAIEEPLNIDDAFTVGGQMLCERYGAPLLAAGFPHSADSRSAVCRFRKSQHAQ